MMLWVMGHTLDNQRPWITNVLGTSVEGARGRVGARSHSSEDKGYSQVLEMLFVLRRQIKVALGFPTFTHIQYTGCFITLEGISSQSVVLDWL